MIFGKKKISGVIAGKRSIRLNELISFIVCIWTDDQKRKTSNLIISHKVFEHVQVYPKLHVSSEDI